MTYKPDTHRTASEQEKRKAASREMEQKQSRDMPSEIAEKANMQRQSKQMHKQTGK
jgi:hypothetical protein